MQSIYVKNKHVGYVDHGAKGWIRVRDTRGNLKGTYEYASDTTRTANGQFYSRGNTVMMLINS